jgi:hypothetical protein
MAGDHLVLSGATGNRGFYVRRGTVVILAMIARDAAVYQHLSVSSITQ